jgi:chaperonin GroES
MSKTKENKYNPNITLFSDRVAILTDSTDVREKTASGIILSEASLQATKTGTVIAVGMGKYSDAGILIPMQVSVGQRVFFTLYAAETITIDTLEYTIVRSDNIIGSINDNQ